MKLQQLFEQFLKRNSLFMRKEVLQASYIPQKIHFRDAQIEEIARILMPVLRKEKPSNIFVYGKTGTGKTLVVKHVLYSLEETAKQNNLLLKIIYLNCKLKKVVDTEYRLFAQLLKEFNKEVPATGLPTDEVYNQFYQIIKEQKVPILLILDEIDQLTEKIGDEVLYNLTRINTEVPDALVALIGISNNLAFAEHLDPRVKSSLSEEELIFPPYNATQLQEILEERAKQAFHENGVGEGVLAKCAALAAQEHGDARRALDLLRVAGELAERQEAEKITIAHLTEAEQRIEHDTVLDAVLHHPKQFQAVLYAVLLLGTKKQHIFTGEIYEVYKKICNGIKISALTQRRVSDIVAELDMLGMIAAKTISKGRYGRMREISLGLSAPILAKMKILLEKELAVA